MYKYTPLIFVNRCLDLTTIRLISIVPTSCSAMYSAFYFWKGNILSLSVCYDSHITLSIVFYSHSHMFNIFCFAGNIRIYTKINTGLKNRTSNGYTSNIKKSGIEFFHK